MVLDRVKGEFASLMAPTAPPLTRPALHGLRVAGDGGREGEFRLWVDGRWLGSWASPACSGSSDAVGRRWGPGRCQPTPEMPAMSPTSWHVLPPIALSSTYRSQLPTSASTHRDMSGYRSFRAGFSRTHRDVSENRSQLQGSGPTPRDMSARLPPGITRTSSVQRIDLLEAPRTEVSSIHPETGEVLTTLIEVSQEQVDEWSSAGFCP